MLPVMLHGAVLLTSSFFLFLSVYYRHMAEATLVRILKARRRIAHHDLVSEATRQLAQRFTATPPVSTLMIH